MTQPVSGEVIDVLRVAQATLSRLRVEDLPNHRVPDQLCVRQRHRVVEHEAAYRGYERSLIALVGHVKYTPFVSLCW